MPRLPDTLRGAAAIALLALSACRDGGTGPTPATKVSASGGTVVAHNGAVTLTVPPGAVTSSTTITVTPFTDPTGSATVVPGTTFDFGPDGTQFAQPVTLELAYDRTRIPAGTSAAQLRVAKLVNGGWQTLTEGVSIDTVAGRVSAHIRSFSVYTVSAERCVPKLLVPDPGSTVATAKGTLDLDNCVNPGGGYAIFFRIANLPAAGRVLKIETSGALEGQVSLLNPHADAEILTGSVFSSHRWLGVNVGGTMRFVVPVMGALGYGQPDLIQVSAPAGRLGAFTLKVSDEAFVHSCGSPAYLYPSLVDGVNVMPGSEVGLSMTAANSCRVNVEFPVIPEARGMPLLTHYHGARLEGGKTYEVSVTSTGTAFNPVLTAFSGGAVAAQDGQGLSTSRKITLRPTASAYYTFELSSGYFRDLNPPRNWITPEGSYILTLRQIGR